MKLKQLRRMWAGGMLSVLFCLILFNCAISVMAASELTGNQKIGGASAINGVDIYDAAGTHWNTSQSADVFTALQTETDSLLAPGLSGAYAFTVENISQEPISFILSFRDENKYHIPMQFRLSADGVYVAGDQSKWVDSGEVIQYMSSLPRQKRQEFTLDWRWIELDDAYDTKLGFAANQKNIEYTVYLSVQLEAGGTDPVSPEIPETGDASGILFSLIVTAATGTLLWIIGKRGANRIRK